MVSYVVVILFDRTIKKNFPIPVGITCSKSAIKTVEQGVKYV